MKTRILTLSVFLVLSSAVANAQSSFEETAKSWHKKAIISCGMLKTSKTMDSKKLKANLETMKTEWATLVQKYGITPPQEYSQDVNWSMYLLKITEIIDRITEHVQQQEYKQALIYCPQICMTFGKMHKVNGLTDLTDIMFAWKMEIKTTNDMYMAGNKQGALKNLKQVEKTYQMVVKMKDSQKNSDFETQFKKLNESYLLWSESVKTEKTDAVGKQFSAFGKAFSKPYLMTL